MIKSLLSTFSDHYFPTSQFNLNTKNPNYIALKDNLKIIKDQLCIFIPQDKYKLSVHSGVGKIAACPWIGIRVINDNFDSKPQTGIYVTLIWRYDGSGICLSLQKGTDETDQGEVKNTVERVRKKYGNLSLSKQINLNAPSLALRPKRYESANIYGKNYDQNNLNELKNDLLELLQYYERIVSNNIQNIMIQDKINVEEIDYQSPVPKKSNSISQSWTRNPTIREKALKNANYLCEMDIDHKTFIVNGHQFMEGHHLIPMEYQDMFPTKSIDIEENIISLCPTCHRKIHYGSLKEKLQMINYLFKKKDKIFQDKIEMNIEILESLYDNI